jgi:hypothetical protein
VAVGAPPLGGAVSRFTAEKPREIPKRVPMAQRLSLGHSAMSMPPSTAVTIPSSSARPRAGSCWVAAAASSITPSVARSTPTNRVRLIVLWIGNSKQEIPPIR